MIDLTKAEILQLCNKYNTEEDQWNFGLETDLGRKFQSDKKITKSDLVQVVKWKFATNKHRLKRELNLIENVSDNDIVDASKLAFNAEDEYSRIKYLMQLKGVGNAVASTILTFYDPVNYGVFDIHMYDELFSTNPKTRPKDISSNPKHYIRLLEELREIAKKHNLDVRVVEKALFKKNYDESKNKKTKSHQVRF